MTRDDEAVAAAVAAAFETKQLPALQALVDQPSHTHARDDVEAAARILDDLAESIGFTVNRHPATDPHFADHRVYETPALGDVSAPAFIGHIDTVHPRSSGFLTYVRDGDGAIGPGVLDMKSGLTAILFAMRAVKEVQGRLPASRVICVTDEEVGSPSSRDLYDALAPQIGTALVFEKGRDEDRIVTSRKGGGTFRFDVFGRAAHAGNHHDKGINAIHALALLVPQIEALTDYELGVTVNVGLLQGGTAKNTVAEHAFCVVDVRFVSAEVGAQVQKSLHEIAAQALPGRLREAEVKVDGRITRPPMELTPENEALRQAYERYAAWVGLGTGAAPRQGGFSDSNLLAAHGIATIDGLGPNGHGAHSTSEWCDLNSLLQRTKALALYIANEL